MDGGLPYEYNGDDDGKHDTDHPMLDRALDDYSFYSFPSTPLTPSFTAPPTTSRDRGVIPEHVANLMNRMSRNKVYLAEESSGIIHHDAQERIRGDPVSRSSMAVANGSVSLVLRRNSTTRTRHRGSVRLQRVQC